MSKPPFSESLPATSHDADPSAGSGRPGLPGAGKDGKPPAAVSRGRQVGSVLVWVLVGVVFGAAFLIIKYFGFGGGNTSHPETFAPPLAHTGQFVSELVPAPAGAIACITSTHPNGDLSFDDAAGLGSGEGGYAGDLEALSYQDGAIECWRDPDGTEVTVRLLRFDYAASAQSFSQELIRDQTAAGGTVKSGASDTVVVAAKPDGNGDIVGSAYGVHTDVVIIVSVAASKSPAPADIEKLFVPQLDKLTSDAVQ